MKIKIHRVSLGLLALMTLGGCASFNDCYYEKTQRVRASKEYVQCGKPECSDYPHDYKKGWIDGFYEVATGGSDCPPAVAPARYYEPKEILKYCDKRRLAYYGGWQDGAARASRFPNTHYLRIYETEACPFPRCEKPCGNGQCVSCDAAFVGMSATGEMIEATPTTGMPREYVEGEALPTAKIENAESNNHNAVELSLPQFNEFQSARVEAPTRSVSTPLPTPAPSTLTDMPTLPLLPPPNTAVMLAAPTFDQPEAAETAANAGVKAQETPLISIPGYRATTQWNRSDSRPADAQSAGFIRLVEPIRDAQKTPTSEGAGPVVVVDAPYQHFKMSDTDAEVQPVIKLVE